MRRIIFAICILSSLLLVGCGEQQQSTPSPMSEKDKAALKGAIGVEMIKKGHEEEGRKLFKEGMDDWMRAHEKEQSH